MATFINWLDNIISSTGYRLEEAPKSYGPYHLIFTFVGLALCIFFAYKLRHATERTNKIVLLSVGGFLAATEIYKQLFFYFFIGNNSYPWHIFPFQLCSVPMYLCLIAPFIKSEKIKNAMYYFMTTFNLLGGIMAFIEPSGILQNEVVLTAHSSIWHMLLVFIGFYLIASGRGVRTIKDYKGSVILFLFLCCIAFSINLIFWNLAGGDINMFYIGPRESPLAVFSYFANTFGWYVSTLLYIPSVCLGAFLIYLPQHIYAKKRNINLQKTN